MSDDEVIRFEITDHDLDNEFNHGGRARKSKKEYQIYGVWAKDSDEDDNEDNVRQRSRKPKNFSTPIEFVAGGVQQAGKKKEKKEVEAVEASTSGQAMIVDSSKDEETPVQPDVSETAGIRRQGQGMRSANLGGNLGNWERHTKGIGAKILLQMGYQPGKGLGKDLQGITAPVEATLRKGRGAIGAYGPEKAASSANPVEEKPSSEKSFIVSTWPSFSAGHTGFLTFATLPVRAEPIDVSETESEPEIRDAPSQIREISQDFRNEDPDSLIISIDDSDSDVMIIAETSDSEQPHKEKNDKEQTVQENPESNKIAQERSEKEQSEANLDHSLIVMAGSSGLQTDKEKLDTNQTLQEKPDEDSSDSDVMIIDESPGLDQD